MPKPDVDNKDGDAMEVISDTVLAGLEITQPIPILPELELLFEFL